MPSKLPDFTGSLIDGDLRLHECLGSGTWGKVYRASRPRGLSRLFAVKCMFKPDPGSIEDYLQTREFINHEYVSEHPNVVTFHRTFSDSKYTYVVLDLCTGGDLFSNIVRENFFFQRTDRIKNAYLQILDAVQHCHQHGVFHRDLKPENILVSNDKAEFFLADFGLSTCSPMSMDFRCGSWEYMSPECIAKELKTGMEYSTRANDIWALGVILINLITKRAPWTRARPGDACFKAFLTDEQYFLRVLPISVETNQLLKRIFLIDPSRRISIPELRREIISMLTFFPDGCEDGDRLLVPIHADDISPRTSTCLRRSASSDGMPIPIFSVVEDLSGHPHISHSFIDEIALAMDRMDFINAGSLVGDKEPLLEGNMLLQPDLDRTHTSLASSNGPITPETHPALVPMEIEIVPDMEQDADIGEAVVRSSRVFKKPSWVRVAPRSKFLRRITKRIYRLNANAAVA